MDIAELLELEHRGWRSLCDGTGTRFYSEIMTSDGVMVLSHGQVLDRAEVAESLRHAPPWHRYEISDERIVQLGAGAAALVYTGRAFRDDEEPPLTALMSSAYVRTDDGWRLAVYQQTPVPDGA